MQRMELRVTQLNGAVNQLTAEKEAIDVKYFDLMEDHNSVISQRDAFEHMYEKIIIEHIKKKYQITNTTLIKRKHAVFSVVNHSPLYSEESSDSYSPKSI